MPINDYNTDPDLNTTISGINIAEGCAPSGINNAIRQLMADVKAEKDERDVELNTTVVKLTGDQTIRGEKTFIAEEIYLSTSGMESGEDRQFRVGSTSSFGQRRGMLGAKSTFIQHDPGTGESGIRGIVIDRNTAALDHDTPSGAEGRELATAAFVRSLSGKSVGDLWTGYDPASVPANVQLYSGQLLSRAAYEAHSALVFSGKRTVVTEEEWQAMVAERGFCPWYSEGDGSTTYRFPLVKGVFAEYVASLSEAGQYKEAGAPNITAETKGCTASSKNYGIVGADVQSGAFFATGDNGTYGIGTSTNTTPRYNLGFDASRSSSVYRDDCDTIQPPALTHLIGEYVVGSVAPLGEADAESLLASVTQLESEVALKMDGDAIGPWVYSFLEASTVTTLGDYSIDVSSYLPSDGKNYEVLVKLYLNRTDSSNTNTNNRIYLPGHKESDKPCVQCVADGANFQQANASGLVPVGADRVINYNITGYKPSEAKLELFAYRKVI